MPRFYYGTYSSYILFVLPAILISLWAQIKVKSTFNRYASVFNRQGLTGAQAARAILDANGLQSVGVERVSGKLTDHYDPRRNVIRLSESVFSSASVAAVGVAAHEAGHAVQKSVGYVPMKLRSAIIPVTQLGSNLSMPLVLLGIIFSIDPLIWAGIILFSLVVVFQLVTLPVEFNASRRAVAILEGQRLLDGDELVGAKKVLSAAAMTYLAALLVALGNLLRLLAIAGRRKD